MKKILVVLVVLIITGCGKKAELKTGDIIFQTSKSNQSKAIALATHSEYTHMGVILIRGKQVLVFHAVNPVKYTPFEEWIKAGKNGHYVVKRPKRTIDGIPWASIEACLEEMEGKPYDKYFGWGDDKIYCSELAWKLYMCTIGYKLCDLKKLSDFDLSNPHVKMMLKERYGDKIPLNEPVVSPADIFDSKELYFVTEQ